MLKQGLIFVLIIIYMLIGLNFAEAMSQQDKLKLETLRKNYTSLYNQYVAAATAGKPADEIKKAYQTALNQYKDFKKKIENVAVVEVSKTTTRAGSGQGLTKKQIEEIAKMERINTQVNEYQKLLDVLRNKLWDLYSEYDRARNAGKPCEHLLSEYNELYMKYYDKRDECEVLKRTLSYPFRKWTDKETTVSLDLYDYDLKVLKKDVPKAEGYCGQYAAYTVLKQCFGQKVDFKELYDKTNPYGKGTWPMLMVDDFKKKGVPAAYHNNATIEDIQAQIDKGYPVSVVVRVPNTGSSHWVTVSGYVSDKNGNITKIKVVDSCKIGEIPIENFKKMWEAPYGKVKSLLDSFSDSKNEMITYDGSKGSCFNNSCSIAALTAKNEFENGCYNKDFGQIAGSVPKFICGVLGNIPVTAGKILSWPGNKVADWGKDKWQNGGFFNKVAGGAATVAGTALSIPGKLLKIAGNCVGAIGNLF